MAKKTTKKQKKTNFGSCNGCFGVFPVGNLIAAPPNKDNLKVVCGSCFNQYIGSKKPVPSTAPPVLKNQHGAYLAKGGEGISSNANAGVVSTGGGGFISTNGANFISTNGANFRRS